MAIVITLRAGNDQHKNPTTKMAFTRYSAALFVNWPRRPGSENAGGFEAPRHDSDPHRDLDLASYGAVAVLDHERGTTYPDMTWEPKQVFDALAAAYARARP
jgi:hypothetical protein